MFGVKVREGPTWMSWFVEREGWIRDRRGRMGKRGVRRILIAREG